MQERIRAVAERGLILVDPEPVQPLDHIHPIGPDNAAPVPAITPPD